MHRRRISVFFLFGGILIEMCDNSGDTNINNIQQALEIIVRIAGIVAETGKDVTIENLSGSINCLLEILTEDTWEA